MLRTARPGTEPAVEDEVLLETRSAPLRGPWAWLGGGILFVIPALVLMGEVLDGHGGIGAVLGLLGAFAATVIRVPRRRLLLAAERLRLEGPFGNLEVDLDEIQGLGCRRDSAAGEPGWENHAVIRTARGDVPVAAFAERELVWTWVAERLVPRLAERHLARLRAGETVSLAGIELDPLGFTLKGRAFYWSELDGMSWSRDGLLLTIADRPHEALVVRPWEVPELPVFLAVTRGILEEGFEPPGDGAPRSEAARVPLGDLPAEHPDLGPMVFARRIPVRAKVLGGIVAAAGVGLLLAGVGAYLEVALATTAAAICGGTLMLGLVLIGWMEPPGGDEFVAYRGGLAAPDRVLPFGDVETLTLQATEHFTNGVYQYTAYDASLTGDGTTFSVGGFGPELQAYYQWFQETVSPVLAAGVLDRLEAGERVDLGCLRIDQAGLEWDRFLGGTGSLGWDEYSGHAVQEGTLHLFSRDEDRSVHQVALSEPNAHVLFLLLTLHEAALREAYEEHLAAKGEKEGKVPGGDSGGEET